MAWQSAHAPNSAAAALSQDGAQHRAACAALFRTELLRRVAAIARAIGAGDAVTVASEANALATGAFAFGLAGLAGDALRTERAARDGAMDEVACAFRSLQCGVHDALAALRAC
jgi:hypothetical protein